MYFVWYGFIALYCEIYLKLLCETFCEQLCWQIIKLANQESYKGVTAKCNYSPASHSSFANPVSSKAETPTWELP